MKKFQVVRLKQLPINDIQPLLEESREQGFKLVERLVRQYLSGKNQFRKPGEALFAVYSDQQLIGVGGLTPDPYLPDGETGRVRRIYVLSAWRGQGVGKLLLLRIIEEATHYYRLLTLRTRNPKASQFYYSLGFQTKPEVYQATHYMVLK